MAQITVPKASLEPPAKIPAGIHDVRFDGFKPKWSKADPMNPAKDKSINLYPQLPITNSTVTDLNGKKPWISMNQKAGWVIVDMVHCFGEVMVEHGDDLDIPGQFLPENEPDPTKCTYVGPLLGKVGKVEFAEVPRRDGKGTMTDIKRFICAVPNCQVQHSENLIKST